MMISDAQMRRDVACVCRIIANEKMDDGIGGHVSVRIPGTDECWANPYPFYFADILPDDIVRVDRHGKVVEGRHAANPSIDLHPAIYTRRPEVNAIVHTHPPYVTGYSALGREIEIYDQVGSFLFGEQAVYNEFTGTIFSEEGAAPIVEALGNKRLAILKNHGLLAVGIALHTALIDTLMAERAARVQAVALQFGATRSDALNDEVARQTRDANREIGHYEDQWEALLRGLRRSDSELFVTAEG
ncbi:MAG: class II aldolase/adducin family protein [Blastocatellia bacterium]